MKQVVDGKGRVIKRGSTNLSEHYAQAISYMNRYKDACKLTGIYGLRCVKTSCEVICQCCGDKIDADDYIVTFFNDNKKRYRVCDKCGRQYLTTLSATSCTLSLADPVGVRIWK